MVARDTGKREIVLIVTVVNVGNRPVFVQHVRAVLNPQQLSVVGNPNIKMKADSSELTAHQQNQIVEIKPHGGIHIWQMPFPKKPDFQVIQKGGEQYGNGYVELTSEKKEKFTFLILPDEAWSFLTAPIAPVFDGKTAHKCSRCGFMFLKQADASSVTCPQCSQVDVMRPKVNQMSKQQPPQAKREPNEKQKEAVTKAYSLMVDILTDFKAFKLYSGGDRRLTDIPSRIGTFQSFVKKFITHNDDNRLYLHGSFDKLTHFTEVIQKLFMEVQISDDYKQFCRNSPEYAQRVAEYERNINQLSKDTDLLVTAIINDFTEVLGVVPLQAKKNP
jgi:hypothetical protein